MNFFVAGWEAEWRDGQTGKAIRGKIIRCAKRTCLVNFRCKNQRRGFHINM